MKFSEYLILQLKLHPSIKPQDVIKLCYQAAYGAEHLLTDVSSAKNYFYKEYEAVSESDGNLYEQISENVCRINLSVWKKDNLPASWLFNMFVASASVSNGSKELFLSYLKIAEDVLLNAETSFVFDEWKEFLEQYKASGMKALHHSNEYRQNEHPAYRIVDSKFLSILPVLKKAAVIPYKNSAKVISIDGPAASGKSTMAKLLKATLNAGIIHMDDFFLPLNLRDDTRFLNPGGNVHYERFIKEVLPYLSCKDSFSYTKFDCEIMDYNGKREVESSDWRIVEGSYSHHPKFLNYADLKVFLEISSNEQTRRIVIRNGEKMAKMFADRWIPLEEEYFKYYNIKEHADIVIKS